MSQSPNRQRYAIDFAVDGDIRFLAHNDMLRMFARACARAQVPVSYTAGFNPRARLSMPFPRPVGQSSAAERLLVNLTEVMSTGTLGQRLARELPAGITVGRVTALAPNDSSPPRWVRYFVAVAPPDPHRLAAHAASLLASDSISVTRVRHKDGKSRVVNIRPYLDSVAVRPDGVEVSVHVTPSGSAHPLEVCGALGMEADAISHLVRRVEIQWQPSRNRPLDTT